MKVINLQSILFFIILFISGCKNENPYISNDLDSIDYRPHLQSQNSGENKYSAEVDWRKKNNNINYTLSNSDNSTIFSSSSENDTSYVVNLGLNQIKSIKLSINNVEYGEIDIFTRSISPPTNLTVVASSQSNTITWTPSSDSDIFQTLVYRSELDPSLPVPLLDETDGIPDASVWSLVKQGNGYLNNFIDTSINTSFNYYYIIKLIDSSNNYRFSYMVSNIIGSVEASNLIGESQGYQINLQSSENIQQINEIYSDKISIYWSGYIYEDFYSVEIWKNDQIDFVIDSNENDFVFESTDQELLNFNDYDVGQGKTWYYKIRINNIYGNFIDSESLTCRTSL